MIQPTYALLSGLVFGVGLTVSQMTNPDKVLAFLDITGRWDASLAFVMIGALLVTVFSFRVVLRRAVPVAEHMFHVPTRQDIDRPLLMGAALFGIGWGMTGLCPGPAIAGIGLAINSLWTNTALSEQQLRAVVDVFIMIAAMLFGMMLHHFIKRKD